MKNQEECIKYLHHIHSLLSTLTYDENIDWYPLYFKDHKELVIDQSFFVEFDTIGIDESTEGGLSFFFSGEHFGFMRTYKDLPHELYCNITLTVDITDKDSYFQASTVIDLQELPWEIFPIINEIRTAIFGFLYN